MDGKLAGGQQAGRSDIPISKGSWEWVDNNNRIMVVLKVYLVTLDMENTSLVDYYHTLIMASSTRQHFKDLRWKNKI